MKWKLNPRTGMMEQVPNEPKASVRKWNTPTNEWDAVRYPREQIAIATAQGYRHLCVCLNNQWRDCGIITNLGEILRAVNGPIVNFHQAWQGGYPIDKPKVVYNGENEEECEAADNEE